MPATFWFLLLIPGAFLVVAGLAWRAGRWRRGLIGRWSLTLLVAGAWASQAASHALPLTAPARLGFGWRHAAAYLLSLFGLGLLWTTVAFVRLPRAPARLVMSLAAALAALALLADPVIRWTGAWPDLTLGGQTVAQFDLWAALWGASWLMPLFTAWLLTWQAYRRTIRPRLRDQQSYWTVTLLLFSLGGIPALIRAPGQPQWPLSAALLFLAAALVGSATLTRQRLPGPRLTARRLARQLTVALAWLALLIAGLSLLLGTATGRRLTGSDGGLIILFLATALSAVLARQLLSWLVTRLLPEQAALPARPARHDRWSDVLYDLSALAGRLVDTARADLDLVDCWLALGQELPDGRLSLAPLAAAEAAPIDPVSLAPDSPLAAHWRQSDELLTDVDLDELPAFRDLDPAERALVRGWGRAILVPVRAGDQLVGLLGLGRTVGGQPPTAPALARLRLWLTEAGPLLAQARALADLRAVAHETRARLEALGREERQWREQVQLQEQVLGLISPELRRPLARIDEGWQALIGRLPAEAAPPDPDIGPALGELTQELNNLLYAVTQIQKHVPLQAGPVRLDLVCEQAVEGLAAVAAGRRVQVNLAVTGRLPATCGDPDRLREAVTYLLHNAIKFNRIQGQVDITCAREGEWLSVAVADTGVGIPAERLARLWDGPFRVRRDGRESFGLGLTLVRFIVRGHGGQVSATSRHGTGSTFTLRLPLVPATGQWPAEETGSVQN